MKAKAVFEVVVGFSLTLFLVALAGLSPVGEWVRQATNRAFFEYVVMIAIPLLILVVTRRNLASYGITLRNFRYHLNIALTAFVPVAFASVPFMFIDEKRWDGALIMVGVEIAVLFTLGWLLRRKPTRNESGMLVGALLLVNYSTLAGKVTVENGISALLFYIFFLGLGEELLFRGYIQSRLNEAWGRPYQFFGVHWGWGVVITSILFGIMHILNLGSLISGEWQLTPWWGLWTFFAGFIGGFVREKTGSIVAPILIHGLPQGIASAFLGV
jgi:uncharacterized protein